LIQKTVLRTGRKIVTRFSGNSDHALFLIVFVLPMTATGSIEILTIAFDYFDHRPDFHAANRDNSVSLRQISIMKKINPFYGSIRKRSGQRNPTSAFSRIRRSRRSRHGEEAA